VTVSRSYRWLFVSLATFALVSDQATKYGMFKWLHGVPGNEVEVVPGWFRVTAQFDHSVTPSDNGFVRSLQTWSAPDLPHVNKGALFGIGGAQKELANWLFAAVSFVAAVAITIWATRKNVASDGWLCAALGLIMGGAVGNCYDRLVFHGVRDFLYFYKIEWPVFNVADCGLVVGTTMLLLQAVFGKQPTPAPAPVVAVSHVTPEATPVG
jgi:signal peptidase II